MKNQTCNVVLDMVEPCSLASGISDNQLAISKVVIFHIVKQKKVSFVFR